MHNGRVRVPRWTHLSICLLLFFMAAAVRLLGIGEKQLWVDEIIQVIHSQPNSFGQILAGVAQDKGGAPADYLVQHYAMKLFPSGSNSELPARFHAAIFGSISVALIYLLSLRLLENRRIALTAAAMYAIYPFHHHYSQEGRPYAFLVLLVLILFIFYIHTREHCSWPALLLMSLCSAIAYYTQPFVALFFVALIMINLQRLITGRVPRIDRAFLAPVISGAAGAVAYIPWLMYSSGNTVGQYPGALSPRLMAEAIKGIGDGSYPVSIILLFLAGCGAVHLKKSRPDAVTALLFWILVPVPLILLIISLRDYFFAARQLIFLTPAIVILAACGLEGLFSLYGKKTAVIASLYACACIIVIAMHYPDRRVDFRSAASYLEKSAGEGDRIAAPSYIGILSFYFPDVFKYQTEDVDCGGCKRVFFVKMESADKNGRDLLEKIQKTMIVQRSVSYRGLQILLFQRSVDPTQ